MQSMLTIFAADELKCRVDWTGLSGVFLTVREDVWQSCARDRVELKTLRENNMTTARGNHKYFYSSNFLLFVFVVRRCGRVPANAGTAWW